MIKYKNALLGLTDFSKQPEEFFDEMIQYEKDNLSLVDVTASYLTEDFSNSYDFLDFELLKNVYYPNNYITVSEAKNKYAGMSKKEKSKAMAKDAKEKKRAAYEVDAEEKKEYDPENYWDSQHSHIADPDHLESELKKPLGGALNQRASDHPNRARSHSNKVGGFISDDEIKGFNPNKFHPNALSNTKNHYDPIVDSNSNYENNYTVHVHRDIRNLMHPDYSTLPQAQRIHLGKIVGSIAHHGDNHGYRDAPVNNDAKSGWLKMSKESGLASIHIPDHGDTNNPKAKDGGTGHLKVIYHKHPKTGAFYLHKVTGHDLKDGNKNTLYQNRGMLSVMKTGGHLLEAIKSFQERMLKDFLK